MAGQPRTASGRNTGPLLPAWSPPGRAGLKDRSEPRDPFSAHSPRQAEEFAADGPHGRFEPFARACSAPLGACGQLARSSGPVPAQAQGRLLPRWLCLALPPPEPFLRSRDPCAAARSTAGAMRPSLLDGHLRRRAASGADARPMVNSFGRLPRPAPAFRPGPTRAGPALAANAARPAGCAGPAGCRRGCRPAAGGATSPRY